MSVSSLFDFAGTEKRRKILAFYGGGLVTVCTGIWAVFTFFVQPDKKDDAVKQTIGASIVQSPTITVSPTINVPAQPEPPQVFVPIELKIADVRRTQMYADVNIQPQDPFTLPVLTTIDKKGSEAITGCRAELWVPALRSFVMNSSFVDSPTRFDFKEGSSRKELQLYFDINLAISRLPGLQVRMACGEKYAGDWTDLK